MKKIIFVTILMLTSLVLYSCDSSKKELQAGIESANKECPMDLGMIGEISSIEFDKDADEVIMTMTISKDMPLKMSALKKLKNTLKRAMMGNWAKSEDGLKLMDEIAKADSKMTIVMRTENTDENIKIKISKDEVKDLAEGKIDPISPRDLLEIMITSTNAQCPMQIDEVTILSSVSLEGTNVVYNYSLDEDVVTMDVIEQNKISIKSNLKQALSTPDPTMKQMIGVCKGANTGISYRYVGNTTGNVCVIKFSPSEL